MPIHFLGVRHHSPACAHLVKETIAKLKPVAVLIEGPCDFNDRIGELLLPHKLPIALFSYRYDGERSAQSWFPFLDYSPEWVALQAGHAQGSELYFIDLPHWSYRVRGGFDYFDLADDVDSLNHTENNNQLTPKNRYQYVLNSLLAETGCDNQDALWDSWFEHAPKADLAARLEQYFVTLRGDLGDKHKEDKHKDSEDALRERFMAQWIRHICHKHKGRLKKNITQNIKKNILVICGGWHVPALKHYVYDESDDAFAHNHDITTTPDPERFVQQLLHPAQASQQNPKDNYDNDNIQGNSSDHTHENTNDSEEGKLDYGNYLIPYEFRQVDALGGYGAGMPSPQYYQWLYDAPDTAYTNAMARITQKLRKANQRIGTADLIAWQHSTQSLALLRGRSAQQPSRHDLLDGFISSCVKEALDDLPPWSSWGSETTNHLRTLCSDDHPALKAILLALTGEKRGELATDTPLPPLLAHTENLLNTQDILPTSQKRTLTLNWRDPAHRQQLHLLWQLHCIGCDSVWLDNTSNTNRKHSAKNKRHSKTLLSAEETWQLQRNLNWHVQLIEASRYGATLALASKSALAETLLASGHNQQNQQQSQQQNQANHPISKQSNPATDMAFRIGNVFTKVIRAGFLDWGDELLSKLIQLLPQINERDSLTHIGTGLMHLLQQGFWGADIDALLSKPLTLIVERLMWLLDGLSRHTSQSTEADIGAMKLIGFYLHKQTEAQAISNTDISTTDILDLLQRIILDTDTSPTLRGASLGVYHSYIAHISSNIADDSADNALKHTDAQSEAIDIIAIINSVPPRDMLGDFLNGLFATAREALQRDDALLHSLHDVIIGLTLDDFLTALPALRLAFSWFSAKERQTLAMSLASHMGLSVQASHILQMQLKKPINNADSLVQAKQMQAQVREWLIEIEGTD